MTTEAGVGGAVSGSGVGLAESGRERPVTIIEPTRGWGALGVRDVWEYRELLYLLTWREIKGNYRQMAFGPLWMLGAPLIQMVIFSVLFGRIFQLPSDGVPYPVFTYSALLPWTLFATAARKAAGSLVNQQQLIAKVYFPRMIIPISQVISALVDFAMSFVILAAMVAVYRMPIGVEVLVLPVYVLLAALTALALGLWLATVAVTFRDVLIMVGFGITIWQYATPVAYSASLIPDRWRWLYDLNPMTVVVDGFRWALLGIGDGPSVNDAGVAVAVVVAVLAGAYQFRRTERTIVDRL